MDVVQILVRHTLIYFLGKVAPAIITMLSMVIFTRLATPEQYGTYSLITVIVGLSNILIFQWLRSSLLRFYNDRNKVPLLIGTILKSHIVTLILIAPIFIIIGIILYLQNYDIQFLMVIYIMVILLSLYELGVIYYRVNLKPQRVVRNNIIKTIVFVLLATIFLYFGFGVWGLLTGSIISSIIGVTLYSRGLNKKKVSFESNNQTLKKMLIYGLPITFSFVLSVALQNIDKIMISMMLGVEQNGNYAVSFDLIHNLLYMIMTSFALAGFPIVLKTIKNNGDLKGKKEFEHYGELFFLISIPATVGLISIAPNLTNIVIGEDYLIPSKLINLIILATFFHGIKSHYFDLGLQISAKTRDFFYPALVAIIVNIVLNYYLLAKYGIEGAALATLIAFLLALILSGIYSRRNYKVRLSYMSLLKVIVSAFIMYLIIERIDFNTDIINLVFKITFGIFVYFISVFVLNVAELRSKIIDKVRGKK